MTGRRGFPQPCGSGTGAATWGRPEESAQVPRVGRLHTDDVGRFDDDGYLILVDRVNDLIIRGGENIYPKEAAAELDPDVSLSAAAVHAVSNPAGARTSLTAAFPPLLALLPACGPESA
jgi:acyl-CoA synthetase (AMP-forming)/AMP-acid ligase II